MKINKKIIVCLLALIIVAVVGFIAVKNQSCWFGLDSVSKIDDSYTCKNFNRTCANNLEMIYNLGSGMAPTACCDPSAGVAKAIYTGDVNEIRGFCVKDWDKTCGNDACDSLENYYNCPWDCNMKMKGTCSEVCLSQPRDTTVGLYGYSGGRCLTGTANLPPQCSNEEFQLVYSDGQFPDYEDCNLYGQTKDILKICCCAVKKQ